MVRRKARTLFQEILQKADFGRNVTRIGCLSTLSSWKWGPLCTVPAIQVIDHMWAMPRSTDRSTSPHNYRTLQLIVASRSEVILQVTGWHQWLDFPCMRTMASITCPIHEVCSPGQYQTLISSSLTALGVNTPVSVSNAETRAGGYSKISFCLLSRTHILPWSQRHPQLYLV